MFMGRIDGEVIEFGSNDPLLICVPELVDCCRSLLLIPDDYLRPWRWVLTLDVQHLSIQLALDVEEFGLQVNGFPLLVGSSVVFPGADLCADFLATSAQIKDLFLVVSVVHDVLSHLPLLRILTILHGSQVQYIVTSNVQSEMVGLVSDRSSGSVFVPQLMRIVFASVVDDDWRSL